ncbi:MAG: flagellin [Clostridia bacterium]|nr:flagellin [Clostridia bacterium]
MRINTNLMALNAQNKLRNNQTNVEKSIQKLSSGLRINSAADDAAGLAISEKMRAQIRGLSQAQDNAQDGISLIQTAEGALQQTTDILQRMRELVIKAQNTGVLTDDDRTSITTEMSTLRDEIDRIATSTTFNSKKLLDGTLAVQRGTGDTFGTLGIVDVVNANVSTTYTFTATAGDRATVSYFDSISGSTVTVYSDIVMGATTVKGKVNFADAGIMLNFGKEGIAVGSFNGKTIVTAGEEEGAKADFKIGANTYDEDILSIGIGDMSSKGLNMNADGTKFSIDISTAETANTTLDVIDYAIDTVSSQRATLGAIQNRMEYAVSSLSATEENLTAAESRIRDVDMADEMVKYTKNNILNQSAMAMLAQANQQPQAILSLLQ